MTGGLMQLVAYGAQDIYLTGNPMITYFKVVYRRHTNFAMESIAQTFNGNVGFNNKVTALISRNGDLVSGLNLELRLPAADIAAGNLSTNVGHHLIEEVSVEIGGQQIDKHYGDWLEVWSQLSVSASQTLGYNASINANANFVDDQADAILYVPLQFWFCRNVGLALPLIALQYHEVKVAVKFRTAAEVGSAGGALDATLWADYIYLDTDERRRFAQVSHEYLIEQLQFSGDSAVTAHSKTVDLNFNHPVKELIWTARQGNTAATRGQYGVAAGGITAAGLNPVASAVLKLNGHERFASQQGPYFNLVQTRCHTRSPAQGINVYSFALKPEDHQPSGTCNFSRIDNAQLVLRLRDNAASTTAGDFTAGNGTNAVKVYAVNYNVLRIMSGMGGLAYSN
jgi:hypothetical protein